MRADFGLSCANFSLKFGQIMIKKTLFGITLLSLGLTSFAQSYCPASVSCSLTSLSSCSQETNWQLNTSDSYVTRTGNFPLIEVVAEKETKNKAWQITCQYGVPSQEIVKLVYTNTTDQSLAPDLITGNTDWYPLELGLFGCDSVHGSETPPAVNTSFCPLRQLNN